MNVTDCSGNDKDREAIWNVNKAAFNGDAEANLVDAP